MEPFENTKYKKKAPGTTYKISVNYTRDDGIKEKQICRLCDTIKVYYNSKVPLWLWNEYSAKVRYSLKKDKFCWVIIQMTGTSRNFMALGIIMLSLRCLFFLVFSYLSFNSIKSIWKRGKRLRHQLLFSFEWHASNNLDENKFLSTEWRRRCRWTEKNNRQFTVGDKTVWPLKWTF